jgi:hypothetical protein
MPSIRGNERSRENDQGRPQSRFHPGEPGYIRVTWTIRHLKRPITTLTIERQYFIPNRTGWSPLKGGLVSHPFQVATPRRGGQGRAAEGGL